MGGAPRTTLTRTRSSWLFRLSELISIMHVSQIEINCYMVFCGLSVFHLLLSVGVLCQYVFVLGVGWGSKFRIRLSWGIRPQINIARVDSSWWHVVFLWCWIRYNVFSVHLFYRKWYFEVVILFWILWLYYIVSGLSHSFVDLL